MKFHTLTIRNGSSFRFFIWRNTALLSQTNANAKDETKEHKRNTLLVQANLLLRLMTVGTSTDIEFIIYNTSSVFWRLVSFFSIFFLFRINKHISFDVGMMLSTVYSVHITINMHFDFRFENWNCQKDERNPLSTAIYKYIFIEVSTILFVFRPFSLNSNLSNFMFSIYT